MIIFILSIASIISIYTSYHFGIKAKRSEETLLEKESIIHALKEHTNRVELEVTNLSQRLLQSNNQLNSLKAQVQSLIEKAKNKAKAQRVEKKEVVIKADSAKPKRKYTKKES